MTHNTTINNQPMMTTSGTCQIGGRAESLAESKETVDSAMSRRHGEK
jgi:hypothetical protein